MKKIMILLLVAAYSCKPVITHDVKYKEGAMCYRTVIDSSPQLQMVGDSDYEIKWVKVSVPQRFLADTFVLSTYVWNGNPSINNDILESWSDYTSVNTIDSLMCLHNQRAELFVRKYMAEERRRKEMRKRARQMKRIKPNCD